MRRAVLTASEVVNSDALHQSLSRQLSLPLWYGGNLDALYDILSTMPDCQIVIEDPAAMVKNLGLYFHKVMRVLTDACIDNPCLSVCLEGRHVHEALHADAAPDD